MNIVSKNVDGDSEYYCHSCYYNWRGLQEPALYRILECDAVDWMCKQCLTEAARAMCMWLLGEVLADAS